MTDWKRGDPMPQTPEQFRHMGDLYERELLARDAEISKLKERINKLVQRNKPPALDHFTECGGWEEDDPIERLRFFCCCAMEGQDWWDVEQFFDAIQDPNKPEE